MSEATELRKRLEQLRIDFINSYSELVPSVRDAWIKTLDEAVCYLLGELGRNDPPKEGS